MEAISRTIDTYQDLTLKGPHEQRSALRASLIDRAGGDWTADLARSEELQRISVSDGDVIAFSRRASDGIRAVGLTLWSDAAGYHVSNIVPAAMGKLSHREYNAALADFIRQIVEPTAAAHGFSLVISKPAQTIEDWVGEGVARSLRAFSDLANKSTGSGHANDEKRWFAFLVAAHQAECDLDADRLARWLNEVAGWNEESAHDLAGQYETGISLLRYYDTQH